MSQAVKKALPTKRKLSDTKFSLPKKKLKATEKLEAKVRKMRAQMEKESGKRPKAKNHAIQGERYSLVLRLPATLRTPLTEAANRKGLSINSFIIDMLSTTVAG